MSMYILLYTYPSCGFIFITYLCHLLVFKLCEGKGSLPHYVTVPQWVKAWWFVEWISWGLNFPTTEKTGVEIFKELFCTNVIALWIIGKTFICPRVTNFPLKKMFWAIWNLQSKTNIDLRLWFLMWGHRIPVFLGIRENLLKPILGLFWKCGLT